MNLDKELLKSIRNWFLLGVLLLGVCLVCGCSSEDVILISQSSNVTYINQTFINGSVVGATPPYLYMVGNNVTQNETKLLSMFLTSESDPVFTSQNSSIWNAINLKQGLLSMFDSNIFLSGNVLGLNRSLNVTDVSLQGNLYKSGRVLVFFDSNDTLVVSG